MQKAKGDIKKITDKLTNKDQTINQLRMQQRQKIVDEPVYIPNRRYAQNIN